MNDLKLFYPQEWDSVNRVSIPLSPGKRAIVEKIEDDFKGKYGSYSPYNTNYNGSERKVVIRGSKFKNGGVRLELHEPHLYGPCRPNSEYSGHVVIQDLRENNGVVSKKNSILNDGYEICSSTHTQDKITGVETITRKKGSDIVAGYEVRPTQRKLMTGTKGKIETLLMKIGTNENGCERPVLRRISGVMLDMLRKIK